MKGLKKAFAALSVIAVALFACACGGAPSAPHDPGPSEETEAPEQDGFATVAPAEIDDVLLNPGKGFVYYGGDWETTKAVRPYVTTGYHRFNWCDLEPEPGVFDFSKIDHHIEDYEELGMRYAFGVMCVNTSSDKEYITPKFVFDESGQYDLHHRADGTVQYIPKWTDEIFLKHVDALVAALGERYNGDPRIAFVDILSYGNWGEQHLFSIETGIEGYEYDCRPSPEFVRDRYMQPYLDAFPDTLLVNPWGYDDLNGIYDEMLDKGITLRRDGICKYTNGLDELAKAYGKLPVIFEYAGNYKDNIAKGPASEAEFNRQLEEAVLRAYPTYIELDVDWFRNNLGYCKDLANRMGYWFRLAEARYPKTISADAPAEIALTFRNDGVAPICEPCTVFVALLDGEGSVVRKAATALEPARWMPGAPSKETCAVPFDAPAGTYTLAVGLFRDPADPAPAYLLGSAGKVGDGAWYAIGDVTVV